ncbi:E3 ubiquitin-protein ligase TRIM21-like [Mugil cephalus]|uniref:E3 ubiquitin-protein ligase TRIM21-like n=1 Tax=Mugil cephalus TaxID=48193 RepID=UPI001FB68C06|nr:E3 ubiquitin-protein ligase TRIM21-like [Mugil cephalus]
MSAASCLLYEDELRCSICLDVFTDPVSTPCGHNFCKHCITQHWDTNELCKCPMCNKLFQTRPEVNINTFICEIVAQFKHEAQHGMKTEDKVEQMIQKIVEMKESVKMSIYAADREKAEGVQVFTALKESVERGLDQLIKEIEDKQKTTEKQAEGFIKDLEQEVSELMMKSSEVKQLLHSEDHLNLLQSFSSLKAAPPTKDWTEVSVRPPSYEGTVVRAVTQLKEKLKKDMKKLLEAQLKRLQQYAVDVTLDPDTANPYLILSDDGKQVYCGNVRKNLPDNPERFSIYGLVLGKQSVYSGRFYFQVQVKGKTGWYLGVARESIDRKGEISLCPEDGFWTVCLRNGNGYDANADTPVSLFLDSRPEKVGVFVYYEEGLVSFHDVDTAALIYSFTGCSFSDKLYPFFSPNPNYGGKNSAPLIICPVNQTVE